MKKRILSLVALIAAVTVAAQAQIFFKVESPDGKKTSYILGTHHFAPIAMLDSLPGLAEAIGSVDTLYGELDMSDMMAQAMASQQAMMAPADSTLDKVLAPEDLAKLGEIWKEHATSAGLPPLEALYIVKPAAISTMLAAVMAQKVIPPMEMAEGIDATMQKKARKAGKKVGALETMEFQANMLFGTPLSQQAKELMKTVNDIDKENAKTLNLTNAYLSHNLPAIEKIILTDTDADEAESIDRLILSRNATWLEKLVPEMKTTPLFVVVGIGHLIGDKGVLNGLQKAGYKVTPIK